MAEPKDDFNLDDLHIEELNVSDIEERSDYELFLKEETEPQRGSEKENKKNGKQSGEKGKGSTPVVRPGDRYGDSLNNLRTLDEEDDTDQDHTKTDQPTVKRKKTAIDYVRYVVMVIALGVFVYAVFQLITIYLEYKAGMDEYTQIAEDFQDNTGDDKLVADYMEEEYPLNPNFHVPVIDRQSLKDINQDVIGWIQFESIEQINYPVVHGSDNELYLHRTFRMEENSAGSIFIETQNKTDFSDVNTFVYGHNMKNNSMFGMLRNYKEQSFYAGNEYFWIYTPQGNYRYKIFSCYEPHADSSETYTWWNAPCEEFTNYLNKVKSYSKYDTGVHVKPTDRIVTLSTCTSRGSNYRFVVHGKMVYSEAVQSAQTSETVPETIPEATPEAAPQAVPQATPEAAPQAVPEAAPQATPEVAPEVPQEPVGDPAAAQ